MDVKIFTDNIEGEALSQIYTLAKHPAFDGAKIRIMPDVHAGKGCVIGFTADLGEKVVPNLVGVDIGCGMLTVELGNINIDFDKLDGVIREYIPSGMNVHDKTHSLLDMKLKCPVKDWSYIERSLGTLGGGNHFIEIDQDEEGNKYLVIHTGSRNLGKQVAEYYQKLAIKTMSGENDYPKLQEELIKQYKLLGREKEISTALENLKSNFKPSLSIPKELCYLTGESKEDYLYDMKKCQSFAILNRESIAETIIDLMDWKAANQFETIHNYIDHESNIVRKGAISAKKDEKVLIPMNMRDGCVIGTGKGNEDWNCSAPHGAGRLMSRSKAKESISLEDFNKSMMGIYTTSVGVATIDEAPMAYKPMEEIIERISDTVQVEKIIKPIYNFKAN